MRSATSTPLSDARAASSSLPLMAGSGVLPPSVTRTTSRSADQTNGRASGTRRLSSLTSRTPGTASTEATALRRPSSENASAENVTSRPATAILVLSRTVSFSAAVGALGQIGLQRRGAGPGRERPKDDKGNRARPPFAAPPEKSVHSPSCEGLEPEKTNPCKAVKLEIPRRRPICCGLLTNCFFSALRLA